MLFYLDFITEQALNTPDIPEVVPHVPGTLRGKRYNPPAKPKPNPNDNIEIALDLGEDVELALSSATTDEIVDLAGIMGLHSIMNQECLIIYSFVSRSFPCKRFCLKLFWWKVDT